MNRIHNNTAAMVIWKTIPGFSMYEASCEGHIRNKKTLYVMAEGTDSGGYKTIKLIRDKVSPTDKPKQKSSVVHIFIALAHHPNPENLPTVHHKNHDRADNRIENLEWRSQKDQNADRVLTPTQSGFRAVWKLNKTTGERLERFESIAAAARALRRTGISFIAKVCIGSEQSAYGFKWEFDEQPDLHGEVWKEINPKLIGGKTNYWVSTEGRVRNCFGRISPGYVHSSGYIKVNVSADIEFCMHRLVALTFLPNFFGKLRVNHKNGNKECPRLFNLEWASDSDNSQHAYDTDLNKSKRPIRQVDGAGEVVRLFQSIAAAVRLTGISSSSMYKYLKKERVWKGGSTFDFV